MNNHDHTENAVDLTTTANTVLDYEMPVRIRIDNPMKCIRKDSPRNLQQCRQLSVAVAAIF